MKKSKITAVILAALMIFGLVSCSGNSTPGAKDDGKLKIVTTVFPLYDWAREIIKDDEHIKLDILLDNGVDLHSYQPSADDIVTISSCDIFIYVGGESDAWVADALSEAINGDMKVLDLLDIIGDAAKEETALEGMDSEEEEKEGENGEKGEVEYDEHIWLSLNNAEICCRAIADALIAADTAHAEEYEANVTAYTDKFTALDKKYSEATATDEEHVLLFADRFPFAYMTDRYGITPYAAFLGCSAESEASFATISFLAAKLAEHKLHYVVTIEGSSAKIADTVISTSRNLGYNDEVKILTMDSMQGTTASDIANGVTYLSVMEKNLETLKEALGTGGTQIVNH